jgi:hypothetical protein
VLKIKLGFRMRTDVTAWAFEKNGLYSVRSAYRLLKDKQAAKTMAATGEARASREDRARYMVWKMNVPPKIRVFLVASATQLLAIEDGAQAETYRAGKLL